MTTAGTEHLSIRKQIENALSKGTTVQELIDVGYNKKSIQTIASLLKHGKDKYGRVQYSSKPFIDHKPTSTQTKFILEAYLRETLCQNLDVIEHGLTLVGSEYSLPSGRKIDILAKDNNKRMVVIEVKKAEGAYAAMGQISYYMNAIDEVLPSHRPCRGIIISDTITEELKVACRGVNRIKLMEYLTRLELAEIKK